MKYLDFNIALKSTNPKKQTTRPKVFTNDLDSVMIRVTITDMTDTDLLGSSAEMLLYMQDRSFFQNSDVTREGNVFKYLLKENEGNHAGIARFQLPVKTADGKTYAQQKLEFEIESGLETKVATEVMIHDWTSLTREARAYIDEFKLIVNDAKEQIQANIVETAVEEKFNNLEAEYAEDLTQVKSHLAETATQLLTKRDKEVKIASSDLDISSQATKIQPINVSDALMEMFSPAGAVSPIIPPKSIGLDKMAIPIAKATQSKNLFDKSAAVADRSVVWSDGVLSIYPTRSAIQYIPCTPNTAYTKYDTSQMAFYDIDKVYISGIPVGEYNFTTPENCAYMGIGIATELLDVYQIELGTYPRTSEYESFASKIDNSTIKNGTIDKDKMNYPVLVGIPSKNAVDYDRLIHGFFVDYLTGILVPNALFSATDYIPVVAGQQWVKNNNRHVAFYDAKKGRVGGIALGESAITYTIPEGVAFQRTSVLTTDASTFQVELGSISTGYVSGKPTIDPVSLPPELSDLISAFAIENEEWGVEE